MIMVSSHYLDNMKDAIMKKLILLFFMFCLPIIVYSQTEEKQYYIYNVITFSGSPQSEGIKVDIDDGQDVSKLKDANGKKITFKTMAAALMYFMSEGWELYQNGASTRGSSFNGIGATSTASFWIIRKPCSQEEFQKAVEDGIKK